MRAAQARAERRSGTEAVEPAPTPEYEPDDDVPPATDESTPESAPEPQYADHDPGQSLAWTGLIFLTVVLTGFMLALLFMLA